MSSSSWFAKFFLKRFSLDLNSRDMNTNSTQMMRGYTNSTTAVITCGARPCLNKNEIKEESEPLPKLRKGVPLKG